MKTLAELSDQGRQYLKEKWSTQVKELEREIIRSGKRLENSLDKHEMIDARPMGLESTLSDAEAILTHPNASEASADLLTKQKTLVDRLNSELNEARLGTTLLTDEEFYLQQVSIDELEIQAVP